MDQDRAEFVADRLKTNLSNQQKVYNFNVEGGGPLAEKPFDEKDPRSSFNMNDTMAARLVDDMEARARRLAPYIAPPGALGLPEVLEKARLEHGIIDAYFKGMPGFDGVVLFQLPINSHSLSKGGLVIMSDGAKDMEQLTSTKAIIISAGLIALDQLRSNGYDIGHVVLFTRMALYRPVIEVIDGHEQRAIIVHAPDIRWSETLQEELRAGKKKIVCTRTADGYPMHKYLDTATGEVWSPMPAEGNPGDYQL